MALHSMHVHHVHIYMLQALAAFGACNELAFAEFWMLDVPSYPGRRLLDKSLFVLQFALGRNPPHPAPEARPTAQASSGVDCALTDLVQHDDSSSRLSNQKPSLHPTARSSTYSTPDSDAASAHPPSLHSGVVRNSGSMATNSAGEQDSNLLAYSVEISDQQQGSRNVARSTVHQAASHGQSQQDTEPSNGPSLQHECIAEKQHGEQHAGGPDGSSRAEHVQIARENEARLAGMAPEEVMLACSLPPRVLLTSLSWSPAELFAVPALIQ